MLDFCCLFSSKVWRTVCAVMSVTLGDVSVVAVMLCMMMAVVRRASVRLGEYALRAVRRIASSGSVFVSSADVWVDMLFRGVETIMVGRGRVLGRAGGGVSSLANHLVIRVLLHYTAFRENASAVI